MSLLDGKYEILSQQALSDQQTRFDATGPDGTALTIIWYDLTDPKQELEFEAYRQVIRKLKRAGLAAVHDVVSRPGAHYVAWISGADKKRARLNADIEDILKAHAFNPQEADVRFDKRQGVQVYGLPFMGLSPAPEPEVMPEPDAPVTAWFWRLPGWCFSWGLALLFVLIGGGFVVASIFMQLSDRVVQVPDLTGLNVNEASERAYEQGLNVVLQRVPSDLPVGEVVSSDPVAGVALRPGRTVRINFSASTEATPVEVPQLRGETYTNATQQTLEAQGLQLGNVAYIYADVPAGLIISQSQPSGTTVNQGSRVDILVSKGPRGELTFLPDMVGLSYEDAQYFIRIAGLAPPQIDRVVASSSRPNTVLAQSIPPNLPISRDSVIRLTLSEGNEISSNPVPSLIGMSEQQASRAIDGRYNLNITYASTLNLPEGVISQTPAPGTEPAGSQLELLINVHPTVIPVPQVSVTIRQPERRTLSYAWFIQPGINEVTARVTATTLDGQDFIVTTKLVTGGELLEGEWVTRQTGPITFRLTLNGQPYGEVLRRNP